MECFNDHYETLQIDPLPGSGWKPIQRCMLLARVDSQSLLEGFNKVRQQFELDQSANGLEKLKDAWAVLGDNTKRLEFNQILLAKAMKDFGPEYSKCGVPYIYIYIHIQHMYIYIGGERERERERETSKQHISREVGR